MYVVCILILFICAQIGTQGHSIHDEINVALRAWTDRNFKKTVKYIHKVIITKYINKRDKWSMLYLSNIGLSLFHRV